MTFSLYMQGTVSNKTSCRIHLKDPSSELNSLSEELLKGNHQKTHVHFTWDETYKSFDPHRPDLSVPCIVIEWAHDDVMAGYELFGVVEDCMRGLNRNLSLRKFMQKIDGEEALTFVLNKAKEYSYALREIADIIGHNYAGRKTCEQALEEISQQVPISRY